MVIPPPHLIIVVHGDIHDRIVQWFAGSFRTGDIEFNLFILLKLHSSRLCLNQIYLYAYIIRSDIHVSENNEPN